MQYMAVYLLYECTSVCSPGRYGGGYLRYYGPHSVHGRLRCGVELDEAVGLNNGNVCILSCFCQHCTRVDQPHFRGVSCVFCSLPVTPHNPCVTPPFRTTTDSRPQTQQSCAEREGFHCYSSIAPIRGFLSARST